MVNELLGIQYNIAKANVTDRKVQNLAFYIKVNSLKAIHKTMDKNKASGIDKVTKEEYERNLEENLENLVKRMKDGSYHQLTRANTVLGGGSSACRYFDCRKACLPLSTDGKMIVWDKRPKGKCKF